LPADRKVCELLQRFVFIEQVRDVHMSGLVGALLGTRQELPLAVSFVEDK
jgi:hypothetical protein